MIIWCIVTLPASGVQVSICTHTDAMDSTYTPQLSTKQKKKDQKMVCNLGLSSNRAELLAVDQGQSLQYVVDTL